ncbi:MAG TPA: hypothetical protein VGG53_02040 [Mycobacterium sp.]|uniref:hypothetical protein n=1 Tax=Mycobacterium sp. TaxID=1785 RepID=UPI002F3FFEF4
MNRASFDELSSRLPGEVGIAIVRAGQAPLCLGRWSTGVAWSTSKVPLAIAALRAGVGSDELVASTIVQSDNAAAEELWSQLGDPAEAARQVRAVIVEAGDPATVIESRRRRAGYTAFGQTGWSLAGQAQFAAGMSHVHGASPVVDLMRNLTTEHHWGLAPKGFAAKGGWGPGLGDDYLVRQFGIIPTESGNVGIALAAAEMRDGGYQAGVDVVNSLADWIVDHVLTEQ